MTVCVGEFRPAMTTGDSPISFVNCFAGRGDAGHRTAGLAVLGDRPAAGDWPSASARGSSSAPAQ